MPEYQAFMLPVLGLLADGKTREVWHEVIDHAGTIVHQHVKYQRGASDAGAC